MKLQLENYKEQLKTWPKEGKHIMAQYDDDSIIVYQSYRPEIGHYAFQNQKFGGAFSLNRMTWIKPNFLWMMYRNGWGKKEGQEVVLAIQLKREAFDRYLRTAVHSSFKSEFYKSREEWKESVQNSDVRLQWDPDHDPYGSKLERRAIQIGIRGKEIEQYVENDVLAISDISSFVNEQHYLVLEKRIDQLKTPLERAYPFEVKI